MTALNRLSLRLPSKTFVFGEYAVLQGGAGFLISTLPQFEAEILKDEQSKGISPFHELSAAGMWFNENKDIYSNYSITFYNKHKFKGLGQSSAEFVSLYYFYLEKFPHLTEQEKVWKILNDFKSLYNKKNLINDEMLPSGYDVVSQFLGGAQLIESRKKSLFTWSHWPFSKYEALLFSTGIKLLTHEHLSDLNLNKKIEKLLSHAEILSKYLLEKSEDQFFEGLKEWPLLLRSLSLESKETKTLIDYFSLCQGVFMTKGCGALGVDVILVIVDSAYLDEVKNKGVSKGLSYLASSRDLIGPKITRQRGEK